MRASQMARSLTIVAGESIPYVQEAFEGLGTLRLLPGRTITSAALQDANVLLARSITKINAELLEGTEVEFVGSASAGVDHIDEAYLCCRRIGYASAPGSNANSVAEYVMAAILSVAQRSGRLISGTTIGIIGVGNIGRLVKAKAQALGLHPVLHDPPLAERGEIQQASLAETLACDIVTLHVPLTSTGPYATHHLINEKTLQCLKPTSLFINAARGEVVDGQALKAAIRGGRIGPVVLDVWEREPEIDWELFDLVTLGTPHIAGHSLDGKANGTAMIYQALCRHLGMEPVWQPEHSLPAPVVKSIEIRDQPKPDHEQAQEIVKTLYDIEGDHRAMKDLRLAPPHERPRGFDALRKHYPVRREFYRTRIVLPPTQSGLKPLFAGLGFTEIKDNP